MLLQAGGPCEFQDHWLAIVNAVFHGFQMLLLTWVGANVSRQGRDSRKRIADKRDYRSRN